MSWSSLCCALRSFHITSPHFREARGHSAKVCYIFFISILLIFFFFSYFISSFCIAGLWFLELFELFESVPFCIYGAKKLWSKSLQYLLASSLQYFVVETTLVLFEAHPQYLTVVKKKLYAINHNKAMNAIRDLQDLKCPETKRFTTATII